MPSTRLLPLLCLILCSVAASQDHPKTPAPDSCLVTRAATPPFVPPPPHPAQPPVDSFWFGTDRLWTFLPVSGMWRLGHYIPADPTFRQKLFFWRQGFNPHTDLRPKLTVSGKCIDTEAPLLLTEAGVEAGRRTIRSL